MGSEKIDEAVCNADLIHLIPVGFGLRNSLHSKIVSIPGQAEPPDVRTGVTRITHAGNLSMKLQAEL